MMSFLVTAALALAATAPATQTPSAPAASADQEKKICKTYKITGSRLGSVKTCATRAEWDLAKREMQKEIQEAQTPGLLPVE